MATHQIPSDKSRIDRSFEVIADHNAAILLKIAEDPSSGLVNRYYSACMDTASINSLGALPLVHLQRQVNQSVPGNSAFFVKNGFNGLFSFRTDIDALNPSKKVYFLSQAGLSLPDPSYYSDADVMTAFQSYAVNILRLSGQFFTRDEAEHMVRFEKAIANITVPAEDLFDPFKSYNRMSWDDLIKLAPHLGFESFIQTLNLDRSVQVALDAPAFFSRLSDLIGTGKFDIFSYFVFKLADQMSPQLSNLFVEENFKFYEGVLSGQQVMPPRNKTCLSATNAALPELAGTLFAKKAFPQTSKAAASAIFDTLLSSFELNIQKLSWMDSQTLQRAIDKLNQIQRLIGYPDHPRTYSEYFFGVGFAANWLAVSRGEVTRELNGVLQAPDRDVWAFGPYEINAAYDPTRNSETLPAGIIQSPYFNPDYPMAMNYGGIGMIGGHELTHSLDSQGRDYTGSGKLEDWWTPSTSAAFQKRVDCIIEQYSKFSPLPGFYVNGNLTQGENIADAGGLKTTHAAYMTRYPKEGPSASIVPGLTNEQLLFVGYAQTWCSKFTPNVVKQRLLTDPHSPPQFRVNGPMMNLPAFSDAFQCRQGVDPMSPNTRCQIW